MNRNFATVDSSNRIVYAPDTLGASLRAPKDWQYHAANYWEIDKTVPTAPEGKYAKPTGLYDLVTVQEEHIPAVNEETGEPLDPNDEYKPLVKVVRQRYEFVDIPEEVKPPRVFSKLYLILALKKRGLYAQFKAMLSADGLEDLWQAANELNEGFDGFDAYLAQAKTALNLTDADVEAILVEAVAR